MIKFSSWYDDEEFESIEALTGHLEAVWERKMGEGNFRYGESNEARIECLMYLADVEGGHIQDLHTFSVDVEPISWTDGYEVAKARVSKKDLEAINQMEAA